MNPTPSPIPPPTVRVAPSVLGQQPHEPSERFPPGLLWGSILLTIGFLMLIVLADYSPLQSPYITTEPQHHCMGALGSHGGYWGFYVLGAAVWLLPLGCLWRGYQYLRAYLGRIRQPSPHDAVHGPCRGSGAWQSWSAVLALAGACTLLALSQSYSAQAWNPNCFLQGHGGLVGYLGWQLCLKPLLGTLGSLMVVGLGTLLAGLFWLIGARHPALALQQALAAAQARLQAKSTGVGPAPCASTAPATPIEAPIEDKQDKPTKPKAPPLGPVPLAQQASPIQMHPQGGGATLLALSTAGVPASQPPQTPAPPRAAAAGTALKVIAEEKVEKATLSAPRAGNYQFPPIDLLQSPPNQAMLPEDHQAMALALVQTLSQFGVEVAPGDIYTGPVITRYEVIPAPGVRVERIANLDKNIALALKATSVRILAPVPGKGCVGVEIPNRHPSPVCLRDIIESRAWSQSGAEIPLVLGKEVTGKPIVADLTKMPHLLIAGSTGSGKTVCINAIIASLLYHASPQELRFLMVDPKIVEMQMYNSLPHMLIPVVTEPKKVPAALKWLIAEMEQRYQIFAQVGVRNIAGFNAKVLKNQEEAEKEREKAAALEAELSAEERVALQHLENEAPESPQVEIPKTKLPYIVCIIDELADLMMVAPADIETCIARLAQLARAAGIHLIIATQRPSVNVITGVIKANLPSRIAFKVASKVDSRTILDGGGADNLIGRGDMLFVPPGTASTLRAQGALVSDEEIHGLVEFLKVNGKPQFEASIQKQMEAPGAGDSAANSHLSSEDELMPQALEILQNSNKPSASLLQRRLRIGYNRAARMVDFLVAEGYLEKGDTSLEEED